MKLSELPDIDFVETDAKTIETAVFDTYKRITGRTLAQGDPVRLFLLVITEVIVRLENDTNYTGKMNLLKYAEGDYLDQRGHDFVDTERLQASAARTTLKAVLSAARNQGTVIPAGTRVATASGVYFATEKSLVIAAGDTEGMVAASCTDTGTAGNDFLPGEICHIVDPVAYVDVISNINKSKGGSEEEDDESYRERIHEAPERLSVAGPYGAYEYWTKSASTLVADVSIDSPSPGSVDVVPLLKDGQIPGEETLNAISELLNDEKRRPLTDNVSVSPPEAVEFDIDVTCYTYNDENPEKTKEDVEKAIDAFVAWTKGKLGRDINPSKLISDIMSVTEVKRVEVTKPEFTVVGKKQVAIARSHTVKLGGGEDD